MDHVLVVHHWIDKVYISLYWASWALHKGNRHRHNQGWAVVQADTSLADNIKAQQNEGC